MKTLATALFFHPASLGMLSLGIFLASTTAVSAQDTAKSNAALRRGAVHSFASSNLTPEMWFYEQERQRHEELDTPAKAVHRNAANRAAERHQRMAARKWFGFSSSRPSVSPTVWYSRYSPPLSHNSYYSFQRTGLGYDGIVKQSARTAPRSY